jgi:hypothetical protein
MDFRRIWSSSGRLGEALKDDSFLPLPKNIFLFQGDAMDELVYRRVTKGTGLRFEDFDLFYTYLVMHEEFAELIAEKGKKGSIFLSMVFKTSSLNIRDFS